MSKIYLTQTKLFWGTTSSKAKTNYKDFTITNNNK